LDGIDSVNGRLALLGCVHSMNPLHFFSDLQSILLTEVYEYLLRLQNSSFILPYFQPFKLYIALVLADYGYVEESQK
jgi:hypothetical protein